LRLSDKRISNFLFVTQGVGTIFVGIFLAAYLGGLPSTNVLHSEAAFRIPLTILGAVLLALILATIIVAAFQRKNNQ
jgi:Zn-dependent protease with chaperone function